MTRPPFEIDEAQDGALVTLRLRGELDLAGARVLDDRLTRLRAKRRAVRLNLSKLEFIDSTGLHLLIRAVGDSKTDGWQFEIEPDVSPMVGRLFRLVHFDPFTATEASRGSAGE